MLVVVGNPKGGCGKTTIAVNLAIMRKILGNKKVLLIDADTQKSAADFIHTRIKEQKKHDLNCPLILDTSIIDQIKNFQNDYDDIVVDTGGHDSDVFRTLLLDADKLLMPILPSEIDLRVFEDFYFTLNRIKRSNLNLSVTYCLNMADTNPRMGFMEAGKEILNKYPLGNIAKTSLGRRIAFRRSMAEGLAVIELPNKDDKSTIELQELYNEVFNVNQI